MARLEKSSECYLDTTRLKENTDLEENLEVEFLKLLTYLMCEQILVLSTVGGIYRHIEFKIVNTLTANINVIDFNKLIRPCGGVLYAPSFLSWLATEYVVMPDEPITYTVLIKTVRRKYTTSYNNMGICSDELVNFLMVKEEEYNNQGV